MGSNKHTGLMRGAKRRLHIFARTCVVAGVAFICAAGCARVSVENVNVRAVGLPRPQMIYVHDFAVSADAVALDRALGARALEMVKGTETEDRIKIAKEIARIVSENLVKEILAQGMPAQLAGTVPVSGPALKHRWTIPLCGRRQPAQAHGDWLWRRGERGTNLGSSLRDDR